MNIYTTIATDNEVFCFSALFIDDKHIMPSLIKKQGVFGHNPGEQIFYIDSEDYLKEMYNNLIKFRDNPVGFKEHFKEEILHEEAIDLIEVFEKAFELKFI